MKKNGILLLNKSTGSTSFKSIGGLKRILGTKTVGHCGTLDSFADGLLLVCIGSATKLVPYLIGQNKTYRAQFAFGEETDTLDPQGEVIRRTEIPQLETIENILPKFCGDILQRPPEYSAVHINGKRAYEYALTGEEVEMPQRSIKIIEFALISFTDNILECRITCTSGTYIRSLARDLALACKSAAYVKALTRENIGPFVLNSSITIDESQLEAMSASEIHSKMISGTSLLSLLGAVPVTITHDEYTRLLHGIFPCAPDDLRINKAQGLLAYQQNEIHYFFVLNDEIAGIFRLLTDGKPKIKAVIPNLE